MSHATGRRQFILAHDAARTNALIAVREAGPMWRVTVMPPQRTLEQNALMWALLTDVSGQVEWYKKWLSTDDWKNIFTASLRHLSVVPGIDEGTLVPIGLSTSEMDKAEMSELIDLIYAFGATRGVLFHQTREQMQLLRAAKSRGRT